MSDRLKNLQRCRSAHYRFVILTDLLFYWVDQDQANNRWLVWKVSADFLRLYLAGEIPLIDIFPKTGEQIYVVDIDDKINYSKVLLTYADLVDADYWPETESYFKFDLPAIYRGFVQTGEYLKALKEKAVYVNVQASTDRYSKTIGIQDIWDVLQNLGDAT